MNPQGENNEDKPFENPFADIDVEIEESLLLNELFDETEYQDNPLAIFIYQAPPLPQRMVVPTFPFPIPPQQGNQNLKNIPNVALPNFYGLITEDHETFLFKFTFSIGAMTTQLMPIT